MQVNRTPAPSTAPLRSVKLGALDAVIDRRPDGTIYLADTESHTIRAIDPKANVIRTVVGTGEEGDGPDGDPLKCRLNRPHGIEVGPDGTLYIGDSGNHRVRMLRKAAE